MRFHEKGLTNADVADYLKSTGLSVRFTKEQIDHAINTGDKYGLLLNTTEPIVLNDFIDGIGHPYDPHTNACIDIVLAHKNDETIICGVTAAQYLLYKLLGISATGLEFKQIDNYTEIVLTGTLSISWSFFNKIYHHF
jgi:hypothetical protein